MLVLHVEPLTPSQVGPPHRAVGDVGTSRASTLWALVERPPIGLCAPLPHLLAREGADAGDERRFAVIAISDDRGPWGQVRGLDDTKELGPRGVNPRLLLIGLRRGRGGCARR